MQAEDRVDLAWPDNDGSRMELVQMGEDGQNTALALTTQLDDQALIQNMLDNSQVNAVIDAGKTYLLLISERGLWNYVEHLVDYDADVNVIDENGVTALMHAAQHEELNAMKCLLEAGAKINTPDNFGKTALMRAAESGKLAAVRGLVDYGANVDDIDENGQSALLLAAKGGEWEVVRCLVENNGANINQVDNCQRSVLMFAVERSSSDRSNYDVVQFLVEFGANVNAADAKGRTPLMCAAQKGELEIVEFLLGAGADANKEDNEGHQAIFFANDNRHHRVHRLLLKHIETSQDVVTTCEGSWKISPFDIELVSFVDDMNIGGEYRAKWLDADVVLKLFDARATGSTFESEVTVWHQLRHPHVIKLYGACDNIHHFFVCEYARNGSLREYMTQCKRSGVHSTPWKFLHEAALGLAYLHERKIVHRNLRGSSILIGNDGFAKLADFELSGTEMPPETRSRTGGIEMVRWQAPEQLRGAQASTASDIYSLGLCIVEAVIDSALWAKLPEEVLCDSKLCWDPIRSPNNMRSPAPPKKYKDVEPLIKKMCCLDPSDRISAASVVQILSRLATNEFVVTQPSQPEPEPSVRFFDFREGELEKSWLKLKGMDSPYVDDMHQELMHDLEELHGRLCPTTQSLIVLMRFEELLDEYIGFLQAGSVMQNVLSVSFIQAPSRSLRGVQHLVDALWAMIDPLDVPDTASKHHLEQSLFEISGNCAGYKSQLMLHESQENSAREAFQTYLHAEMSKTNPDYTTRQMAVMIKVFDDLVCSGSSYPYDYTPYWFVPWYEFVIQEWDRIGEGGFGNVFRAKWLDSDVAVKEVKRVWSTTDYWSSFCSRSSENSISFEMMFRDTKYMNYLFRREVEIWFGLNHPHIIRLFGACHIGTPMFACEYASNGTLDAYLRKHPFQIWEKLYEAALGVQYLHSEGIIHGDLKCNNIMVGSDGKAKVTDFGLSSVSDVGDYDAALGFGAYQWMAPECFYSTYQSACPQLFASDIYALGMCVIEALRVVNGATTATPWESLDSATVKFLKKRGEIPSRPTTCTESQWKLVQSMCSLDPDERIKISTAVDELKKLAYPEELVPSAVIPPSPVSVDVDIAEMKAACANELPISLIYKCFWDRISHVSTLLDSQQLRDLAANAEISTRKLKNSATKLIEYTNQAIRGYTLHRRLDKFIEANFLDASEASELHNWKHLCSNIMSSARVDRSHR